MTTVLRSRTKFDFPTYYSEVAEATVPLMNDSPEEILRDFERLHELARRLYNDECQQQSTK
jgi:DNA primase